MEGLLGETAYDLPINTHPIAEVYNVEPRPFARGKFASVRRCTEKATGVEWAAKCVRRRGRRHEVLHEARVLALSAPHPHIVRLHEVYESPSEIVLVLELVEGGELQRVLDEDECIGEKEATRFLAQIIKGVSFLHSHNIAHLDIKPQNLLLTQCNAKEADIKLCDFGISRRITKGVEIREIVGTPDYVAPEILHYEPISLATDMWSIGILTYVLLCGCSPFGGDTKQETFCNITRGQLEFPTDLFGQISSPAMDFIRRLLIRDPSERMTAQESLSHPWLSDGDIQLTLEPANNNANQKEEKDDQFECDTNANICIKDCIKVKNSVDCDKADENTPHPDHKKGNNNNNNLNGCENNFNSQELSKSVIKYGSNSYCKTVTVNNGLRITSSMEVTEKSSSSFEKDTSPRKKVFCHLYTEETIDRVSMVC